jgi:hypothetical protein
MDTVKKIAVIVAIGFFVFYLIGAISSAQSHPRERAAPYAEYFK